MIFPVFGVLSEVLDSECWKLKDPLLSTLRQMRWHDPGTWNVLPSPAGLVSAKKPGLETNADSWTSVLSRMPCILGKPE